MKRFFSFLLILSALLSLFSVATHAAVVGGACGDNLTWSYDESTLTMTISGTGKMYDYDLLSYTNQVLQPWNEYKAMTTIIVEEGVESLGKSAFHGCFNVTEITLPETLTAIGNYAFCNCYELLSITIPETVTTIGKALFEGCWKLEKATLPSTMTELPPNTFNSCSELESVVLPEGITKIGTGAFYFCPKLSSVNIPEAVEVIGSQAFYSCGRLSEIHLGSNLKQIEASAFSGCSDLTSVTLPEGLLSLGIYAFEDCTKLSEITIPASLEAMSSLAFSGCLSLEAYHVAEGNPTYSSHDGVLYNTDKTELLLCPPAKSGEYAILEGTVSINDFAMAGCGYLTEVTIPNTVTTIGSNAMAGLCISSLHLPESITTIDVSGFSNCNYITELIIPSSVEFLGESAFYACSRLKTVTIEEGLHYVRETAFADCTALETVYLPESIATLGYQAFSSGENLRSVYFRGAAPNLIDESWSSCFPTYGKDGENYITNVTLYYLDGQEGWTSPYWKGYPTATWDPEAHVHSYEETITAPTCTEQGYTTYTCACGDSYIDSYTDALGHSFFDGICTVCGAEDPNNQPPQTSFSDVLENAWYYRAVNYAVENKLMNGMGNNRFEPETAMSRAMLVTVLWRYAGEPLEGANSFTDIKDGKWYTEAVSWASHNGIVGGVGNNRFAPDGSITREQLATILFRYCSAVGIDTSARADLTIFPDSKKISSYANDAISWAVSVGLVTGTKIGNQTYLDPQGNATRAQVATILMRFIENIAAK